MSIEGDTRDRVIRMEAELEAVRNKVDRLEAKVDKIYALLTEARGASKAVKFLIWLSGTSLFMWLVTFWDKIAALVKPSAG